VQDADTVWIETEQIRVGICERGAKVVSVKMNDFAYQKGAVLWRADSLIELIPDGSGGGAGLSVDGHSLDDIVFFCDDDVVHVRDGQDSAWVTFAGVWNGIQIEKRFGFSRNGYVVDLEVRSLGLTGRNVTLEWGCGLSESEWTEGGKSIQTLPRKAHVFDGKDIEHIQLKKAAKEERSGSYRWAGVTSKYFLVAMISVDAGDADVRVQAFSDSLSNALPKSNNLNYAVSMTRVNGESASQYHLFLGPMKLNELRSEGIGLQRVLYRGWGWFFFADRWFPALCEGVLWIMLVLGRSLRDYGVAIVLLTIAVKVVTYPLVQSSMKSMGKMRDLQPKINALRNRYKSDPKKMNEELMGLYRKEGVNPFNPGCLPMFLQMPVLFSLYVVLGKAIELRGAATVLIPWVKDLSQKEILFQLPFEIPFYGCR
jgi:YidC/Oxa1 family membrane protein insertase